MEEERSTTMMLNCLSYTQPHLNDVASQKTEVPLSLPVIVIHCLIHDSFCAPLIPRGRRGRGRKLFLDWLWQRALGYRCGTREGI